ncbi:MAG: ferredoxin--NADP reductase [Bacteroidota bacterium]
MAKTHSLKIKEVVRETADAITIHFQQPLLRKISYKPGQFLTLTVPVNGKTLYRSYSLCSAPKLDKTLAVTVKRVENGVVSNFLNDHVKAGKKMEIAEPSGRFTIENTVKDQRHVVLIGGGSGITPLMSIMRSTLFNEPKSKVSLVYANRNEASVIFKDALKELQGKFPDRLHLQHFLSQPAAGDSIEHQTGRLTAETVSSLVKELPFEGNGSSVYYICGPNGMMEVAEAGLKAAGIPEASILQEHFVVEEVERKVVGEGVKPVTLIFDGDTHELLVDPSHTILEAAMEQGLYLPYSCQSGICSTCMGKVHQGTVEMDNNESLTDEDLDEGYVLLCQAHPTSDDVKVEVE